MVSAQPSTNGHGGRREGSGAKTTDQHKRLTIAKAKREEFKAKEAELDYRERQGELYDRAEVQSTLTTAIATFAEQVRGIPDKLERKAGLTPKQAELSEELLNEQLSELKKQLLALMTDA